MTPTPTSPGPGEDWTAQVVDYIVKTVDNLKRYTVDPVRTVTKALIYGTLAVGFALPATFLVAIALFHLLVQVFNAALPGPDDNAWMAWYLLGIICVGAGAFLFSRRNAPASAEH
jgi:hypothetical protein